MNLLFRASCCSQTLTRNPDHDRAILALAARSRACPRHRYSNSSGTAVITKHHGPEYAPHRLATTRPMSSDSSRRIGISTSAVPGNLAGTCISTHKMVATAGEALGSARRQLLIEKAERRPTLYGLGRGVAAARFSTAPRGSTATPPPPPPLKGSTWNGGAFKLVGAAVLFAGGFFGAQLLNRAGSSSDDVSESPVLCRSQEDHAQAVLHKFMYFVLHDLSSCCTLRTYLYLYGLNAVPVLRS